MQVIANTPLWVWPLLALLVWLGARQLVEQQIAPWRVWILPLVVVALSVTSTALTFGPRLDVLAAWAGAAVAIVVLNGAIVRWPRGVSRAAGGGAYVVPGSVVPLLLILGIFAVRFLLGFTAATRHDRLLDPQFSLSVCAILGVLSGAFLSRSLVIVGSRSP